MNPTPDNERQGAPEPPASPFLVERLLRDARRRDEEPANADGTAGEGDLAEHIDPELPARRLAALQDDPVELAQELAYQAYESETPEQALALVTQALTHDPDNADALTVRAFIASEDASELIAALERAVACAENNLGSEFFVDCKGNFWPMVEARPYLRTVKQLAEVLWEVGRRFDAVAQYENLLELDPHDHMGNGLLLLGNYLSMGEVQRAWDLLEDQAQDESAVYAWAWVLLFLLTGDEEAAVDALNHALDQNPYVAPLFVGMGDESAPELPPVVPRGGEEEARLCDQILGEAWERAPMAQDWLYEVLVEMGLLEPDAPDDDPDDPSPPAVN